MVFILEDKHVESAQQVAANVHLQQYVKNVPMDTLWRVLLLAKALADFLVWLVNLMMHLFAYLALKVTILAKEIAWLIWLVMPKVNARPVHTPIYFSILLALVVIYWIVISAMLEKIMSSNVVFAKMVLC